MDARGGRGWTVRCVQRAARSRGGVCLVDRIGRRRRSISDKKGGADTMEGFPLRTGRRRKSRPRRAPGDAGSRSSRAPEGSTAAAAHPTRPAAVPPAAPSAVVAAEPPPPPIPPPTPRCLRDICSKSSTADSMCPPFASSASRIVTVSSSGNMLLSVSSASMKETDIVPPPVLRARSDDRAGFFPRVVARQRSGDRSNARARAFDFAGQASEPRGRESVEKRAKYFLMSLAC